ncbi:MAG: glycerol-3-phosphate ABC transporter ATP-binding protein [Planctomycetes bacterium GWF2_41_51]|nr:MAG: glycerol-3-phosphate ABC transporter ATP-binding protein [Planctomycetes bacterium GWF2_41_51]HBG27986.1 glycerol-3-phosphate ABC transporter ATP-binding protein [Phycisphaerales bacterium]
MANVIIKNLTKRFNEFTAVDDLNIEIKDKEFAVLVGPSGCGKTTTLRIIAGLEEASSGQIFIGDKLVNNVQPKDRDIAMVFQNYALYPHMDVYNNMAVGLRLRNFSKKEIDQRVRETAAILGIESLLKRKPRELSGGQRQRVAVGRAIVKKPKVFLFDEPLSNLDAKLRVTMRTEISKLHRRLEATIIYVTHDQVEAMTMANRIFIMDGGRLQQSGPPLQVYKKPTNKFVAGFIGSPAANFIDSVLTKENGSYYVNAERIKLKVPDIFASQLTDYVGKEVVFGVRPEDIHDKRFFFDTAPSNTIKAKIDVIEPLGSEIFIYLTCGKNSFVGRMDSRTQTEVEQNIEIAIDMEKTHIFDPKTSLAIV